MLLPQQTLNLLYTRLLYQYDFEREKLKNRAAKSIIDNDTQTSYRGRRDNGGGSQVLRRRTVEADDKGSHDRDQSGWRSRHDEHDRELAGKRLERIDSSKELGKQNETYFLCISICSNI